MKIVNMVAIAKLSQPLDLSELHCKLGNSTCTTSTGHWLKFRLQPENYYVAFYRSGKFLITGPRSYDVIEKIAHRVITLLHNLGYNIKLENIQIHNIVIEGKINISSSLEDLLVDLDRMKASYEPEQFPGLIYKDWGVSFLLFSSGKFILTGVKAEQNWKNLVEMFNEVVNR